MGNNDGGPINLICPRCGHFVPTDERPGEYPGALSRYTELGSIEVCSACGTDEAMLQFRAVREDVQRIVHPLVGARPWVEPPADLV